MNAIRSVFRLVALAMVAVMLVLALTIPAATASKTCAEERMFDEVVILSVTPVESSFQWDASELLSYGNGKAGKYTTGQLEVQFNDINTEHNITHYDVIATPSSEPGTSKELGIEEKVTRVDRPSEVGSTVTAVLGLEPGTNYDINVVANYYSIQTSPKQGRQDSFSATTFLSPPFLGSGFHTSLTFADESPADYGVHFLVYKVDEELHSFSWLNPADFGPFDHVWKADALADPPLVAGKEGADILCTNRKGNLDDSCNVGGNEDDDAIGITHYRLTITDQNGIIEYLETVEKFAGTPLDGTIYSAEFSLNDGTYNFAVDAGYEEAGQFYALSDKAQVQFDIPNDYRKFNQTSAEIEALLDDIVGSVAGKDEAYDPFLDSVWNYRDYASDGSVVKELEDGAPLSVVVPAHGKALTVYLNNLYD